MEFFSLITLWFVPVALTLGALIYTFCFRLTKFEYWDGAVGNWLTTLLGIIFGIPVAMYLDRKRTNSDAKDKQNEERQLRKDMLTMLIGELNEAILQLAIRCSLKDTIPTMPMKLSTWNAMRDSGNLIHISDPRLLSAISGAHHLMATLADREKLLKLNTELYLLTLREIDHALIAITEAFEADGLLPKA